MKKGIGAIIIMIVLVAGVAGVRSWIQTPADIFDAAAKGNEAALRQFLANGENPQSVNKVKDTPLHLASTRGVADQLLARRVALEARNAFGSTPLHMAAVNGYPDVVEALLEQGADVNALDMIGNTPLDHALLGKDKKLGGGGQDSVIALLRAHKGLTRKELTFASCTEESTVAATEIIRILQSIKDAPSATAALPALQRPWGTFEKVNERTKLLISMEVLKDSNQLVQQKRNEVLKTLKAEDDRLDHLPGVKEILSDGLKHAAD